MLERTVEDLRTELLEHVNQTAAEAPHTVEAVLNRRLVQHEQAIQAYKERAQEAHHSLRRHKLVHKLKTTSASSSP